MLRSTNFLAARTLSPCEVRDCMEKLGKLQLIDADHSYGHFGMAYTKKDLRFCFFLIKLNFFVFCFCVPYETH